MSSASERFGCSQYCIPHPLSSLVVAVIRSVQSSPRFKTDFDFCVFHCYQGTSFAEQCNGNKRDLNFGSQTLEACLRALDSCLPSTTSRFSELAPARLDPRR